MKVVTSILALLPLLAACGESSNSSSAHPAAKTLAFIRANGFPKLSELLPSLPPQLARIPGVETSASGLPSLPDAADAATFEDLDALLSEAQQLATQGFSEARRMEATLLNLAGPIYDMLGRPDLFARAAGAAGAAGDDEPAGLTLREAGGSVFEHMVDELEFSVATGGTGGMPAYVVLGVAPGITGIRISGLWPEGEGFVTGFDATLRLDALDDMELTLTLVPGRTAGLLADWKSGSCADDLWQLVLTATPEGEKTMMVNAHECPGERNAVSSMQLGRAATGDWRISGGFAQTFAAADGESLRGWLGARQGFVMQAAASGDLSKLAGAAAVLAESDFAAPTQELIDQFGVGQLLSRYFNDVYWKPMLADEALDSPAYWMCSAPFVSDAILDEVDGAKELCKGKPLDPEIVLTTLSDVRKAVEDSGLAPDDVLETLDGLVAVLQIRNSLFVSGDGALAFKDAPDDSFAPLDGARKGALPAALAATDWKVAALAQLPLVAAKDLPGSAFEALAGGLGRFLGDECKALAADASSKAGKQADLVKLCGG
jgi:hypothetical protein